ncbi:A.superbus venom factor 1-like [Pyxicephalus adspersus]|uniref:A.superbus venom factor 1-like n=1 Tax=Pyxicephalus adspersus TaxID=30357 RepID=UPI003B59CB21
MASILGLSLIILFFGAGQTCILITPNLLRVDSEETIVVDGQGHGSDFEAHILIQDFPRKRTQLAEGKVTLNNDNLFLDAANLTISSQSEFIDPSKKQFVSVILKSKVCEIEKVVLLTFNAGYVFIQTDKPIYTPGSKVLYRLFSMDYKLMPKGRPINVDFLTPDNIIVKQEVLHIKSGTIEKAFELTELVSVGKWTIVAKYDDSPLHNYTTHFEVKEYVLPSFEITLTPLKKFFYVDDEKCEIKIEAHYLYGKPVNGKAFVLFGVKTGDSMKSLPDSLTRVEIADGEGEAVLKREHLVKYFQTSKEMLGLSLYVTVSVITESGTEIVEAMIDNIYIVESPYKIVFAKTSKYFKPGMPFDLRVLITNPDGSPADKIPIVVNPGAVKGSTQEDGIAKLTVNTKSDIGSMEVLVKTDKKDLPDNRQANATMTAIAYEPLLGSGNYLHISVPMAQLKVGDNIPVNFNIKRSTDSIPYLNYLILSRGRIMAKGSEELGIGNTVHSLMLSITSDLLPSFRLVAYYVANTKAGREIVSDAAWVDVVDSCVGTLEITGDKQRGNIPQAPGGNMKLKLRADHNAKVGLVAVDKAVYVLNKRFKISQAKVWDSIEKSDIGCTVGSGANSMQVFFDAGLAIQSNFGRTTIQRTEPLCHTHGQRKRRSTIMLIEQKTTKASQYQDLERKCCLDGMHENPMGHSCERRSGLIVDGELCVKAFLDCCNYIQKKKETERALKDYDDLARSDEDTEYIDDEDILIRTDFPESWFWKTETMTEKPEKGISTKILNIALKESITTWEVLAVSIAENKGICVSQPFDIQVMTNFFIDLKLPYSVVVNEQVEIRAILNNYGSNRIKVRVDLSHNPEFCSLSTQKKKFRQEVYISPSSSVAVPFIIIPLSVGIHDIEIKAAGQYVSDGIKKKVKVVPEGMRLTKALKSVTLEPEKKGTDGLQIEKVSPLNETNIVPKTDVDTIITIQGTPISQMVEDAIDGINLNHLISMPHGCGEQNMMRMSPGVIATHYLDATNQWDRIGLDRRAQSLQFINKGYTQQLTYRKDDHSYSVNTNHISSTWLTAYVVKIFAMAYSLQNIDKNTLCKSVEWLISKEDKKIPGKFKEIYRVYHQEMIGGLSGSSEPDAVLTAFVLIALLESRSICQENVMALQTSINNASNFLLSKYQTLEKPYSIAVTSYALALEGKLNDTGILMNASTDMTYWDESGSRMLSLEATAYGLLTLLRMKQFNGTGNIARWLMEQKYFGEVYASTQATVIMFQALTQYQLDSPSLLDLEMDISIELPERKNPLTYRINNQNALYARSEQTKINREFVVKAKGTGQGTLTVMSVYHALVTEKQRECNNFDLSVTVQEEQWVRKPEGAKKTFSLTVCFRFLKSYDATMSILDISMMTGFSPDVDGLNKLMNGVDRYFFKFEINKEATDKTKEAGDKKTLIIYLDKVSHNEEQCLKFNIHQFFEVGLIQPASVTLYDYYTPENRCTKFYHAEEGSALLGKICHGQVCRCAEANCFLQQQLEEEEIDAFYRMNRACAEGVDYVYKARIVEIEVNDNYDNYVMTIVKVIKSGTDEFPEGQQRNFISHVKCRKSLDLIKGREYLIWGNKGDLWNQPSGYAYIIGKGTWIEWWPNDKECQDPGNEELCDVYFEVSEYLGLHGCSS